MLPVRSDVVFPVPPLATGKVPEVKLLAEKEASENVHKQRPVKYH